MVRVPISVLVQHYFGLLPHTHDHAPFGSWNSAYLPELQFNRGETESKVELLLLL